MSRTLVLTSLVALCACGDDGNSDPDADVDHDAAPIDASAPVEVCDNGADDDGDTSADCADTDCASECVAQFSDGVLIVNGDAGANSFVVTPGADAVLLVNDGAIPILGGVPTVGTTTQIQIFGHDGDDELIVASGLPPASLAGGAGNDTLLGGSAADLLDGGAGSDTLDGNAGNDTLLGGDGDDLFNWDPGDGSDVFEGLAGIDTLRVNGSAGAEIFAMASNGSRLLFTRNVGSIVLDADDIELVQLRALGGTDSVTVNDLLATDVSQVAIDLGISGAGDGAADAVIVSGTAAADTVSVTGSAAAGVTVEGSPVAVQILTSELANDRLTFNLGGGDDLINLLAVQTNAIAFTVNGGSGSDVIRGSNGNDVLNGEAGNDVLLGQDGADVCDGGTDTDFMDGGAGTDSGVNGETVINIP